MADSVLITPAATGAGLVTHPIYNTFLPVWQKLSHVREGTGGFLDGGFLVGHPREFEDHTSAEPNQPTKKFKARKALACFENVAQALMDAKRSSLFREAPTRRVGDPAATATKEPSDLENWWNADNGGLGVDGRGATIDQMMPVTWDASGTFGHVVLYMDRPAGPSGATAAEAKEPFLRAYTPLDVVDWLQDDQGAITAVKFREAVPRTTLTEVPRIEQYRTRVVDKDKWTLYDQQGNVLQTGDHQMGCLPVVYLYAIRRPLVQSIGQSVLGDPNCYIDIYNLTSEVRELLRNQTFSFINVPLGSGDSAMTVDDAVAMLGKQLGTMNVIFSGAPASMLTGDAANVTSYHDEIARRLRTIFRLAGVQWETDSRDAEAKGSLSLKRDEMNTRLANYADEIERAEYKIAELYYRAKYGADLGPKKLADDHAVIHYPDNFDVTPFEAILEQAQGAMTLGFPGAFLRELRKSLIAKFFPEADPTVVKQLEDAIDAMPDDPTPADRLKARVQALTGAADKNGPVPPVDQAA